jgi:ribosomal protein L18E
MPLQRRIPKRGFTNLKRKDYQVVNVRDLARLDAGEITPQILEAHGLIRKADDLVKVLGMGEIQGAYHVSAHRFSESARGKIEGAGGTVTVLTTVGSEDTSAPGGGEGPAADAAGASAGEAEETGEASAPEGEEASEAEEDKA